MKIKTALLTLVLLGLPGLNSALAQVGIGTSDPKTTLQVEGDHSTTTTADGIQGPSLSLAQLDAKIASYGRVQDGAIVYIDDVFIGSTSSATANITTKGYYYYDATNNVWKAMGTTYSVGDFAQGGIVFWVDETGQHGLVAAKEDITELRWYAGTLGVTQAKGDGPYAGEANTSIIIAVQAAIGDDGISYAARKCNELQITEGGKTYGDWYFPSKEELNLMYQNKATIDAIAVANGGSSFASAFYWSSTETEENSFWFAWRQSFVDGSQMIDDKIDTNRIRAVRAF